MKTPQRCPWQPTALLLIIVLLNVQALAPTTVSRRNFVQASGVGAFSLALFPGQSLAAGQVDKDKANIVKGYQNLNYLLDNWEEETTICKTGNDNPYLGCDRTPVKVMESLGFKSTESPLFKAEKTLQRLETLVPSDMEGEYQEAIETWIEKAEEGSGMAYISSWGESNPGGGKDRVALFIERSRKDVVSCRDALGTVVRILKLDV